ncbi:IclR family transcriptional regulator [Alicycliphilus denitrificans]|uniref:IclR family transcriptional regulator n=1 Tax=Alicycliphilus denitrificans TaxID=179636 RepID=UPI00384CBEE6
MNVNADPDGKLVSALVRGISILRCFSNKCQELSAKELMDLTGLPKPTLFRLTETLCELGLLRYSERLSKYVPGLGLLQLSSPVLTRMALRQFARGHMQALADLTEGQVQLAVGHRRDLCLVELANGMGNTVFRQEVGVTISLSRTATGRAYLLGMAEEARAAYLRDLQARNPQRADWLEQRLVTAREDLARHGFCRSHGDLHSDIESIAVPMSQAQDGELWIFAVSVPVFSPHYSKLETDLGPRLRTLVRSVETVVGGGLP